MSDNPTPRAVVRSAKTLYDSTAVTMQRPEIRRDKLMPRAPRPGCEHEEGYTFTSERGGYRLRWCSTKGCGALGVKTASGWQWAQPSEGGEEQLLGILASVKAARLR